MSFFILPYISVKDDIHKLLNVSYFNLSNTEVSNTEMSNTEVSKNTEMSNTIINKTLYSYLKSIKEKIEPKIDLWDKYKKIINPYEYIHSHIPNTKQSICKLNPLSRSFFKMIELVNMLDLFEGFPKNCNTFHLAEGPGGFIEATSYLRQNKYDTYYGMTLINDKDNIIPGWKKTKHFLNSNPNVIIEKGIDGTGNIIKSDNLRYCYEKFNDTMHFITADGGFDFSSDFNNQELISGKLLFSQIAFALAMQKKGGHFVIKCFDTFKKSSIDMIYLLSMFYTKVYFVKPHTSRYTNSEKYIVCKHFNIDNNESRDKLILKMIDIIDAFETQPNTQYIEKLFDIDIPHYYLNKIEECNAIIGQQQIENIFSTLNIINNCNNHNRFTDIKNIHIQKCIGWCKKYKLPYNKNYGSYINNFKNKFTSLQQFQLNSKSTNVSVDNDSINVDVSNDNDIENDNDMDTYTDVDLYINNISPINNAIIENNKLTTDFDDDNDNYNDDEAILNSTVCETIDVEDDEIIEEIEESLQ